MSHSWLKIEEAANKLGLLMRGGFHCAAEDGVPDLPGGEMAASLLLLGNAGGSLWRDFSCSPEYCDGLPDPLDRWSRRIMEDLAEAFGGRALLPSDGPPYMPFQAWARRAEGLQSSPIGPLIHPRYGLWHAYRGALALPSKVGGIPEKLDQPHPCDACELKPCLSNCPVGAFSENSYDVASCVKHIAGPDEGSCMAHSCLARRSCPIGRDYLYEDEQSRFHMERFLEARLRSVK